MAATSSRCKSPDFIEQDQNENSIKEENQDPGFIDYSHCKTEIKEEIQDPDFIEQDHHNNGTKAENEDPDLIDPNHKDGIKEEDQDPESRSTDPCGSTHHQVRFTRTFVVKIFGEMKATSLVVHLKILLFCK